MAEVRYWPTVLGRPFCALFGWIGHDWQPTLRAVSTVPPLSRTETQSRVRMHYGRQCRRCWRCEDCPCLGFAREGVDGG